MLNVSEESVDFFKQNKCTNLHSACAQNRQYPPGLKAIIEKGKAFSGAKLDGTAYNNREHHELEVEAKSAEKAQETDATDATGAASPEDADEDANEDEFGDGPGGDAQVAAASQASAQDRDELPIPNEDDDEFES